MPAMRADETTVAKEDDRMGMLIDIMNDPFQTIFLYLGYESMTGRTADFTLFMKVQFNPIILDGICPIIFLYR